MTDKTVVRTQSPIKAWVLTKFFGLKVRAVYATPVLPILGAVFYSRCWVLVDSAPVQQTLSHMQV